MEKLTCSSSSKGVVYGQALRLWWKFNNIIEIGFLHSENILRVWLEHCHHCGGLGLFCGGFLVGGTYSSNCGGS